VWEPVMWQVVCVCVTQRSGEGNQPAPVGRHARCNRCGVTRVGNGAPGAGKVAVCLTSAGGGKNALRVGNGEAAKQRHTN